MKYGARNQIVGKVTEIKKGMRVGEALAEKHAEPGAALAHAGHPALAAMLGPKADTDTGADSDTGADPSGHKARYQ